jgi:transposase
MTAIIDLTPVHDCSGPARLLGPGRSATALTSWLAAQPTDFGTGADVVAMDGFAGYRRPPPR